MADVHIRAVGSNADAIRAIEELKLALAGLHNETVRVRVEQEKLGRVSSLGPSAARDVRSFEQARVREVDNAERAITRTVERETRKRQSILRGVGGDIGGSLGALRSLGPQTGPKGIGLVGAGIGAGVATLGPLRNLLGLVGALPAAFGAAGVAAATFSLTNISAVTKAAAAQQETSKKLAAGTITAKAAAKAMKNATLDLTAAQKQALPWAKAINDVHEQAANTIQRKMLPALGALGVALKANQRTIMSTLSAGAGNIGGAIRGVGGILSSGAGQSGLAALGRSSNSFLGAFSNAAVGGFASFLNIAKAAQPLVRMLSHDITVLSARFASWSGSLKGQMALTKWFDSAHAAAVGFLHVIFNLGAALNNLATGSSQGTGGVLAWLDKMTNAFANWTGSAAGQKSIGDAFQAAAGALRTLGDDFRSILPVAKSFLSTVHEIASAIRSMVPGGANTIGLALGANFALGGLPRKIIGRGAGSILGRLGGGLVGGGAAAGAGALGGEAAAAGGIGLLGAAAAAAPIVIPAAAIVGAALLANHFFTAKKNASDLKNVLDGVAAASARAASVMTGTQIHAKASSDSLAGRNVAQLGALTAASAVRFDKSQIKAATGQQKVYWTIMLQLDRHSLQEALNAAKRANDAVNQSAETHREDARSQKDSTQATQAHIASMDALFTATQKVNGAVIRGVQTTKTATVSVSQFSGAMLDQAAAFARSDPKAAHYAASAARLAQNIGRIPTKHQVDVYVNGLDSAIYSIDRFKSMLASIPLSVQTVLTTINPGGAHGGRGAGYTPPKHGATGMYLAGTYRGKDTIPAMLAPGEAVLNPRQIDMLGRGRVMGALAQTGGQFHNATGFASGGFVGMDSLLGSANAYEAGNIGALAGAAASHYSRIPKLLAKDAKRRNFLIHDLDREQSLLARLRRQKAGLTGAANAGKRKALGRRISEIMQHTHEQREELKRKKREIATLTGELGIVPGEDAFQALVDDLEGQRVAATTLGSPARSKALLGAEITDYTRRVKWLSMFTQIKSVRSNRALYQAANTALVARAGELDSLKPDTSSGGGGGSGGGTDQHTQDVIDALQTFTAQAINMQAISASEISTAMDFLKGQVGAFAGGTGYVPRTGMALVHQGEAIIPAWQNGSSSSGSMTGEFKISGSDALTSAIAAAITPAVQIEMGRQTRRLVRERRQ